MKTYILKTDENGYFVNDTKIVEDSEIMRKLFAKDALSVLRHLAKKPSSSESDIAKYTKLSKKSVSKLLGFLTKAGLVAVHDANTKKGLKNLEYRGYDSCGVALLDGNEIVVRKDIGLIDYVNAALKFDELGGNIGIGHTRWGTTGGITKENAHPLLDCAGDIAVVHNGIIENWQEIKASLNGHKFSSETDTELLSHLLEDLVKNGESLDGAAKKVFSLITGASSFVALNKNTREVVAVKKRVPPRLGDSKSWEFHSKRCAVIHKAHQ